ncbi:MAG: sialidase family protein [Limnochordia bacterium]|jgi:sialidase-1
MHWKKDLFVGGQDGYHTYRIPAIVATENGTLLAFCEGRRNESGDAGAIDLLLRRSVDGGQNWSRFQVVVDGCGDTAGNPAPVVDKTTGTVWLLFCKNDAEGGEPLILQGKAPRTIWVTRSLDDGISWDKPKEITDSVKDPEWTWYATGPCHGIRLSCGRLIVPCDHVLGANPEQNPNRYYSHIIYSDDHGQTWNTGGTVGPGTNESTVAEPADGRLYLNCRSVDNYKRAVAFSSDRGESFQGLAWSELIEPRCQASVVSFGINNEYVFFANPAGTERKDLTIRLSSDGCRTWEKSQVIYQGPAAYSDLCVWPNSEGIGCLFENGQHQPYEQISLVFIKAGL